MMRRHGAFFLSCLLAFTAGHMFNYTVILYLQEAVGSDWLSGVGFGYADGPDVLRDVKLILRAGSFHFLTGPSGAGKSSLLKLLTLVEKPHQGRSARNSSSMSSATTRRS